MRAKRVLMAIALFLGAAAPAAAFAPNGCEQQRKQYPANWNDTSREKTLFVCESRGDRYRVKIGASDEGGRTMMSLVPVTRTESRLVEETSGILRIWLDKEQAQRLREGKYFATIVRKENSCWIRGNLNDDTVFFMDNAKPQPDDKDGAGIFYNKAPRFGVFNSYAYYCEPAE